MDKITAFAEAFATRGKVLTAEKFAKYTSLGVGGSIRLVFFPSTNEALIDAFQFIKRENITYKIVGKGSNLLPDDETFEGIVLNLTKIEPKLEQHSETRFTIHAGYPLQPLSRLLAKEGFTGHEFLSGIPGTIGGAIYMNAGTPEGEIKDVLIQATIVDGGGNVRNVSQADLQFGYRSSALQKSDDVLILAGDFYFEKERVAGSSLEYIKQARTVRKEKQPIELPTCGSVFRNPPGGYAGALIETAGLKGFQIGGAQVSSKHANFIVNRGGASAADVRALILHIQATIKEETGIELLPEVEFM
jgi:UDP-N-acetylmuramate dehydrogenase